MRSVPISHSITGPLARSIGPGFTGAERGKALTNAGGLGGPPLGVHYSATRLCSPCGVESRSYVRRIRAQRWVRSPSTLPFEPPGLEPSGRPAAVSLCSPVWGCSASGSVAADNGQFADPHGG